MRICRVQKCRRAPTTFDSLRQELALALRQRSLAFLIQSAQLQQAIMSSETCDQTDKHEAQLLPQLTMTGSCRRSVLVPTKMMGVSGAWWRSSGIHFDDTFSYDAGDATEKQTRKTSVIS